MVEPPSSNIKRKANDVSSDTDFDQSMVEPPSSNIKRKRDASVIVSSDTDSDQSMVESPPPSSNIKRKASDVVSSSTDSDQSMVEPPSSNIKRKRDPKEVDYDKLSKEELIEKLKKLKSASTTGYQSTNLNDKDELNKIFASNLKYNEGGKIVILDHTEFGSTQCLIDNGVFKNQIVIPQYDEEVYEEMKKHEYGDLVELSDLETCLTNLILKNEPVCGIYADLTSPLQQGVSILQKISNLNLTKKAVIGITICLRNPEGNSFANEDAVTLHDRIMRLFPNNTNLIQKRFNRVTYHYGNKMKMVTCMFAK